MSIKQASLQDEQLATIRQLFSQAESIGLPLWLDGGWAVDAKLGRITREHEDIDVVFPQEHEKEYREILRELGFSESQKYDYGFVSMKNSIVLDSERGQKKDGRYIVEGYPENSCSETKDAQIAGMHVRSINWDKMYYEFLFLEKEVQREDWKPKHFASLKVIEDHLDPERREELRRSFIVDNPQAGTIVPLNKSSSASIARQSNVLNASNSGST